MNSYLKFLSRNKLFTLIEVLGLSIALAFVIVILRYGIQENSMTNDIPDANKIYVMGFEDYLGMTYNTAPAVSSRIPEISNFTRLYPIEDEDVFYGEKYLTVNTYGIDTNFNTFLGFLKMEEGNVDCINGPNTILISRSFANQISDGKSVVGEVVAFAQEKFQLTIGGVYEDFKDQSLFNKADILININHPQIL